MTLIAIATYASFVLIGLMVLKGQMHYGAFGAIWAVIVFFSLLIYEILNRK